MNWRKIIWLAIFLFIAQASIGFVDGALVPMGSGASWFLVGHVASFVVCAAIFSYFAKAKSSRPFVHAWLGLLLQALAGLALSAVLAPWLGSPPWVFVVPEWAVLVVALVVGTSLGISIRHRAGWSADA